jgi:hypothetical protein
MDVLAPRAVRPPSTCAFVFLSQASTSFRVLALKLNRFPLMDTCPRHEPSGRWKIDPSFLPRIFFAIPLILSLESFKERRLY